MDRIILHCDMNSFYASVELLEHPELQGKPVAVSGSPDNRHGIILAKNEEAKRMGVRTAETIWQARSKCPELHFLKPHHEKYQAYSRMINEIYESYTDMVEPFSIDESWLDVTGSTLLFGSGIEIADKIRNRVFQETGLTLSAGVSFNKIFAKMGSEYKKPNATTLISRENFQELLWPMDAGELFFVGAATKTRLAEHGIRTIGDIAQSDRGFLQSLLGKQGTQLYDYANGLENSPVSRSWERHKVKSVGNGITFRRNLVNMDEVRIGLTALSDTVSGRLRKVDMKCQGVKVDIRGSTFRTISRQKQLPSPTNLAEELIRSAMELVLTSWDFRESIRMLTVTGIQLCEEDFCQQLSLFPQDEESRRKAEKVERAIDAIRLKYGSGGIQYGGLLGNDIGLDWDRIDEINE